METTDQDPIEDQSEEKLVFYIEKRGLERFMGPLQAAIMEAVFSNQKTGTSEVLGVTVDKIHEGIISAGYKKVRYTTVAKVAKRMAARGLLIQGEGIAINHKCLLFSPTQPTKDAFEGYMVRTIMSSLLDQNKKKVVTWFLLNIDDFLSDDMPITIKNEKRGKSR